MKKSGLNNKKAPSVTAKEKLVPVLYGVAAVYVTAAFLEPLISWVLIKVIAGNSPVLHNHFLWLNIDFSLIASNRYIDLLILNSFLIALIIQAEISAFLVSEKSSFGRRIPVLVFQLLINLYMIILMLRGIISLIFSKDLGGNWMSLVNVYKLNLEERLIISLGMLVFNFMYFGFVNNRVRKYMSGTN